MLEKLISTDQNADRLVLIGSIKVAKHDLLLLTMHRRCVTLSVGHYDRVLDSS
jgi:hypothetical protein